jgi:hypothetical protein
MGEIPRADPAATPRMGKRYEAKREAPIFEKRGDDWSVIVTPISGVSHSRRGVSFEVQAEFTGPIQECFEAQRRRTSRRRETWHTPEPEAARRVAVATTARLKHGDRDLFLPQIAYELGLEDRAAGWPDGPA